MELSEFLKYNKEEIRDWLIDKLVIKIEKENKLKHICLINEWEDEDYSKIVSSLDKNKFNNFEAYECKRGDFYKLPPNANPLIIYNFDLLCLDARNRLIKELFNGEYKDRLVIIFTKTVIDVRNYPQIETWVSTEGYLGIADDSLGKMIDWYNIIQLKFEEYKSVIEKISVNEKEKARLNIKLSELSNGKLQYDAYAVDFWYDLKSFELYNDDSLKDFGTSLQQKYFPEFKKTKYVFAPEGNYWIIKVNDIEPVGKQEKKKHQINHTKSKAIRYLVYIIKYFGVNNPLSFEHLSRSISKWISEEEKVVKYSTFSESMTTLFKQYPFLQPIDKYLFYNERGKGCYYQENPEIEINLTAIDIPFIHLEN